MTNAYAKRFWRKYLRLVRLGREGSPVEDPLIDFRFKKNAGEYDPLSDEEYRELADNVMSVHNIWERKECENAGEMLLSAIRSTKIDNSALERLVKILADCSDRTVYVPEATADMGQMTLFCDDEKDYQAEMKEELLPKKTYEYLNLRIRGQNDAKRAAAMIMYNSVCGGRSNTLFIGPTGCGKSEIWRHLAKAYPDMIRIADASRLTADGWKGSLHVTDIFEGTDMSKIRKHGLIVVLDEADKVFCEPIVGASGTDFSALLQGQLLKMFDGDTVVFEGNDGSLRSGMTVDCSHVSFVLLGAFERTVRNMSRSRKKTAGIGFLSENGSVEEQTGDDLKKVSGKDLITSGMRRELLGRISRTVYLDPLTQNDYKEILKQSLLPDIMRVYGYEIRIEDSTASEYARLAYESGLGVRHMRSLVLNAIDDRIFESPHERTYCI